MVKQVWASYQTLLGTTRLLRLEFSFSVFAGHVVAILRLVRNLFCQFQGLMYDHCLGGLLTICSVTTYSLYSLIVNAGECLVFSWVASINSLFTEDRAEMGILPCTWEV